MNSATLKFQSMDALALFTKQVTSGYLINTAKLTVSGKFTTEEIRSACENLQAADDTDAIHSTSNKKIDWL